MDLTKEQYKILCKSWTNCDEDHRNDWTSFVGRKHGPYMESPNSLGPKKKKKNETDEEQSQEHAHNVHWHQGDCLQIIHLGTPNSQFRILLCRFTVTA
jgi:hypothetical protein